MLFLEYTYMMNIRLLNRWGRLSAGKNIEWTRFSQSNFNYGETLKLNELMKDWFVKK